MKHFTFSEFVQSDIATKKGIDNVIPNVHVKTNIRALVDRVLDPLREFLELPIIITSGYRSPAVNRAVGGSKNSQHMCGQAADITFRYADMILPTVYLILQEPEFKKHIDQCIYYKKKRIIHISISDYPRGQFWIKE